MCHVQPLDQVTRQVHMKKGPEGKVADDPRG